jgi:hypothetical protein
VAFSFTTHPIFAPLITLTINGLVYSVGLRKIKSYGNNSINLRVHRYFIGGACSKIESMTARDKASEMVSEMLQWQPLATKERTESMNIMFAKQCALIAVTEILSIVFDKKPEVYDFYYDVKTEIEKL